MRHKSPRKFLCNFLDFTQEQPPNRPNIGLGCQFLQKCCNKHQAALDFITDNSPKGTNSAITHKAPPNEHVKKPGQKVPRLSRPPVAGPNLARSDPEQSPHLVQFGSARRQPVTD